VEIAVFWAIDGGDDGLQAFQWLRGTEVEMILREDNIERTLEEFWQTIAQPLLSSVNITASCRDFRHAYSLVSSRAFYVDGYHRISMVPYADAWVSRTCPTN